jgi:hypothetical protein
MYHCTGFNGFPCQQYFNAMPHQAKPATNNAIKGRTCITHGASKRCVLRSENAGAQDIWHHSSAAFLQASSSSESKKSCFI